MQSVSFDLHGFNTIFVQLHTYFIDKHSIIDYNNYITDVDMKQCSLRSNIRIVRHCIAKIKLSSVFYTNDKMKQKRN